MNSIIKFMIMGALIGLLFFLTTSINDLINADDKLGILARGLGNILGGIILFGFIGGIVNLFRKRGK